MPPVAFTGIVPPVLTPLTPEGQVDVLSLERLVGHLLDGGVHGLFPLGSSGETVYLTDAQRDLALEVVVKTAGGAVPVIAGCIEPTTPRVLDRVRTAQDLGVDAVVATAPFYTIVGPHEVERHFRTLAAATELPVLAYDIPVCVHTKLGPTFIADLAGDGVLAGVKDSSGDDVAFRELLALVEDRGLSGFAALTGHEVMVDAVLMVGAAGAVPGLANVDPAGYVRLWDAVRTGDWPSARAEQDRLVRLFRIVGAADPATSAGSTRGVGAFKTALAVLGLIDHNAVSLPMRPLDEEETTTIAGLLEAAGLR